MPSGKAAEYLDAVCSRIRWKRAKKSVRAELAAHIEDLSREYAESGLDSEAACDRAALEMGDPKAVGDELDRLHRPKPNYPLIGFIALFLASGVGYTALKYGGQSPEKLQTTLSAAAAGLILFAAAYFFDYTALIRRPMAVFCAATLLPPLLIVAGTNIPGLIILQSAKYLILLYPAALAVLIYSRREKGIAGLLESCVGFLVQAALSAIFIRAFVMPGVLICGGLLLVYSSAKGFFGRENVKRGVAIAFAAILAGSLCCYLICSRFFDWYLLNFDMLYRPGGYSSENITAYVGGLVREIRRNAKLVGDSSVGAELKWEFFKYEADYELAYLLLKAGRLPVAAVVSAVSAFGACGLSVCLRQKSAVGRLISLSILSIYAFQTAAYILANLGLYVFALPLPLISYGGASLVVNLALLGLLLSVFRSDAIIRDVNRGAPKEIPQNSHFC